MNEKCNFKSKKNKPELDLEFFEHQTAISIKIKE